MTDLLEDFESFNSSDYNTDDISDQSSLVYEGGFSGDVGPNAIVTNTVSTISTGETPFGLYGALNSTDAFGSFGPVFGGPSQGDSSNFDGYAAVFSVDGGEFRLFRWDAGSKTKIASTAGSFSPQTYYEVVITEWDSNGNITAELRGDDNGNTLTLSVTDATYSGDVWGFRTLFLSGAFDLVRKNLSSPPSAPTNLSLSLQ